MALYCHLWRLKVTMLSLYGKEQHEHSSKHLLWCFYRFEITLRWLNNDKMFISGYTIPLSLGNIFSLFTIRCRESFPFVFLPRDCHLSDHCVWGALTTWMWIILLHSDSVSPSNPEVFETVPEAILAHLATPLTVSRPSKSLIGPLHLSITGG